jgi:hypothetical protein
VTALATVLALLSAATFAVSTSVQHQAAEAAPDSAQGVVGLLHHLARRPVWLAGQVFAVVGLALHALALHFGPIALVQPIVISGIVLAVPVRAAISGRAPSRRELVAVSVTALGLAVFLVASNPTAGEVADLGVRPVSLVVGGVVVASAAAFSARVGTRPVRAAFLLGVTSGVLFGLVAGLIKLSLQVFAEDGAARLLETWPLWALVVVGAAGVVTNQVAYRLARLSASMPVLNIVDGLVALAFGLLVFQEVPRHSPLLVGIEVMALVGVTLGLVLVARLEDERVDESAPVPERPRPSGDRG